MRDLRPSTSSALFTCQLPTVTPSCDGCRNEGSILSGTPHVSRVTSKRSSLTPADNPCRGKADRFIVMGVFVHPRHECKDITCCRQYDATIRFNKQSFKCREIILTLLAIFALTASFRTVNLNGQIGNVISSDSVYRKAPVSCIKSPASNTERNSSPKSNQVVGGMFSQNPSPIALERKTFKRFMEVELWRKPQLEDMYPVLCSIELACRDINRLMRRVSTDNLSGYNGAIEGAKGSVNIQGEDQKKLDVIANRIMKTSLCCSGKVSIVASEEDEEPCLCSAVTDNVAFNGEYAAVFDPLDGSSNIDSGLPTGTIFGIYRNPRYGPTDPLTTVKQKGSELVAAGYCLYSASTHIVITMNSGLHMFTLDDITGEFFLTRSNIKMPRSGSIYSFNDAHAASWEPGVRYFFNDLKAKRIAGLSAHTNAAKKPSARYMGALVADAHNIILNGGIFGYPGTVEKPKGKLRLLYEANPLGLIMEEAGGMASNGKGRILDLVVNDVHQRTPLFIGSILEVTALEKYQEFFTLPPDGNVAP
jgi:fructose-1,6-bisphosphatase I